MNTIQQDIKDMQFKNIYLIFGEESYLVRYHANRLAEKIVDPEDSMNFTKLDGTTLEQDEILEMAQTLPFFAERRVILIDGSGWFHKSGGKLIDFLPEMPDSTYLIFKESKVDKRNKLYKYFAKNGRIEECKRQNEKTLQTWVLGILKREQKKITRANLELFLSKTGSDMQVIHNELEKLLCYCMYKDTIEEEDIYAICADQLQDRIFAMIDAIAMKDRAGAISLYAELLQLRKPAMQILALITRQFHILMQLKDMRIQDISPQQMAKECRIPAFAVRKNLKQAEKFSDMQLRDAVHACVQAEEDIKNGRLTDQIAVELLIVQFSASSDARSCVRK